VNTSKTAMIERRQNLLGSAYKLFYHEPVHLVRGEGVWLYDADGRKYLDMYNNVPHVGHCHPQVVEAMTKQIATLNTHTRYLHENVLEYAERLTDKLADELDTAMSPILPITVILRLSTKYLRQTSRPVKFRTTSRRFRFRILIAANSVVTAPAKNMQGTCNRRLMSLSDAASNRRHLLSIR